MKEVKEYFIAFLKVICAMILFAYCAWILSYAFGFMRDAPFWVDILTVSFIIIIATIAVKRANP